MLSSTCSRLRAAAAVVLAALLLLPLRESRAQQGEPQALPTVQLNAGMHNITAQVALTPTQREIGLMYRTALGANEGMLFVFDRPGVQCFWMKNTLLPLSVAFLADDGRIVNIAEMAPRTLDSHCSAQPVRLVLEMNAGWFAKRGFKAGSVLGGPVIKAR